MILGNGKLENITFDPSFPSVEVEGRLRSLVAAREGKAIATNILEQYNQAGYSGRILVLITTLGNKTID